MVVVSAKDGSSGDLGAQEPAPEIRSRVLPRNWVPRPRLDDLLDRAVTRPLTVLVAPAGSGKTVMLQGWAARTPGGRRRQVQFLTTRPRLGDEQLGSLDRVLQELAGRPDASEPVIVVVDDAHLLRASDLARIADVLETPTASLHLVLATRRDLDLPLVSLRLEDALTEIRADQLLFRDDEADALIAAHAPGSTDLDVSTVRERGKGWAAALVLGARAVSGASDRVAARYALAVTEQPILDYLLGEVFDTLDARTCHVLLCTCASDTVNAADAVAMSADPDAVALLSRLAAEGMLVTASSSGDGSDVWPTTFTYHPLLVELLRRRVRTGNAEHALYAAAQMRIVHHHLSRGDPGGALHYATRLDNHQWLIRLLCEHGVGLLATGRAPLVRQALEAVPDQLGRQYPALIAVRALERRVSGDVPAAIQLAGEAIRADGELPGPGPATGSNVRVGPWTDDQFAESLTDSTLILRCWLARIGVGSTVEAVALGRSRLGCAGITGSQHRHLAPGQDIGPSQAVRGWLLTEVAVCETWLGDLAAAHVHIDSALATAHGMAGDLPRARGLAHASVIEWAEGDLTAAGQHASEAVTLAEQHDATSESFVARAHVVLAWLAMQRLEPERMERELLLARSSLHSEHDSLTEVAEHVLRGHLLLQAHDVVGAGAQLESTPATAEPLPRFLEHELSTLRARVASEVGDAGDVDDTVSAGEPERLTTSAPSVAAVPPVPSVPSVPRPLTVEITSREGDVLRELALGGSYADIAETLYITENTVKTHVASLYRKLGSTRRSDALRAARRAGLLAP